SLGGLRPLEFRKIVHMLCTSTGPGGGISGHEHAKSVQEGGPPVPARRCKRPRAAGQGEIEVLRETGTASVLLGHVRGGEWLGEMGVIEGRSRSATARAA